MKFRDGVRSVVPAVALLLLSQWAAGQTAILGDTHGGAHVFPNLTFAGSTCPASVPQTPVTGVGGVPHGVGYYGSDFALISDFSGSRVFNVQISTSAVLNTIATGGAGYNGTGSIAVAPNLQYALMIGGGSLVVMQAPFSSPTFTSVALAGSVAGYQTEAIVFDAASRAYVATTGGIAVLDPPYTSVLFTIAGARESVAITPSGNQLLATGLGGSVQIYTGPFSAATTFVTLPIPGASGLDGITVTPDGNHALVVDASVSRIVSIVAPYSATSALEVIPLLAGTGGLEDISVSADGNYAAGTGQAGPAMPLIKGPFTAAGATVCEVPIVGGRGAGAVRFLPTNLQPPLGPSVQVVPTLSEWGYVVLAMLLALAALAGLRRRIR